MMDQDTVLIAIEMSFEKNIKELKRFLETKEAKKDYELRNIAEMWLKEAEEMMIPIKDYWEVGKKKWGRFRKKKYVARIAWKARQMKKKMKQHDLDAFEKINKIIGDVD